MAKHQRQQELLQLLQREPLLQIQQLAQRLSVTSMTIRRDLDDLDKQGLVIRTYGGALLAGEMHLELSHQEKESINWPAKEVIANLAAKYIQEGDTLFIGAGTTCLVLLNSVVKYRLKIVTNSLTIFNKAIQYNNLDVILCGGNLRKHTQMFVGKFAQDFFQNITLPKVFMSSNGVSLEGFSVANEQEAEINRLILSRATNRYLLIDSSKFEAKHFAYFWPLERIDMLFCENFDAIPKSFLNFISVVTP